MKKVYPGEVVFRERCLLRGGLGKERNLLKSKAGYQSLPQYNNFKTAP